MYEEDVDNVSIDRIGVPRKLLRPGEVVKVSVTATNHARRADANVPLEVVVDGDRKAEQVLELAPSATQTVTFPLSLAEPGRYHGRVGKNRDRLPIDDDRYFLIEVSNTIPVTVVTGRRRAATGDAPAPSAFYVEKALNPRGSADNEFAVRVIDERDVTASVLPANGVVVWVDPQNLEPKRMVLLERHVRRGGGLLVFLGNAAPGILNDTAFRALVGIRGGAEKGTESRAAFTSFEKEHPIFNLFTKDELELLSRAQSTCVHVGARCRTRLRARVRGRRRPGGLGMRARSRSRARIRRVTRSRDRRHSALTDVLAARAHVGVVPRVVGRSARRRRTLRRLRRSSSRYRRPDSTSRSCRPRPGRRIAEAVDR